MIAIDLSKEQSPDADPKAIQHINFNRNLNRAEGAFMFFILEEIKELFLTFHKELYDFVNVFCNNLILSNIISK